MTYVRNTVQWAFQSTEMRAHITHMHTHTYTHSIHTHDNPPPNPPDPPTQVRQFQPKMVAIRDASKVSELKALIKDVPQQPEILVGDEGAVEVRRGIWGRGEGGDRGQLRREGLLAVVDETSSGDARWYKAGAVEVRDGIWLGER